MNMSLTPTETQCLMWVAAGKTSYGTGTIMDISPRTVDYHIYNVCLKLGVHNRQAAVSMAHQLNLLPDIKKHLPELP